VKLEGRNRLHLALGAFYGEDDPFPTYERPRRAAWRCPACCVGPWAPHRLTVALDEDGEPPECFSGCSEDSIWRALGGPVTPEQGRTEGPSSERKRMHGGECADESNTESSFTSNTESSLADHREHGLSLLNGLPLSIDSAEERLSEVGKEARAAELAQGVFGGAGIELGESFSCPLPGHDGQASMWLDERTRLWKLCCWCKKRRGGRQEYWRLADVRAARASRVVRWLADFSASVWYRRLWFEVGVLEPAPFELPPLEGASGVVTAMRVGLALLFRLRWITNPGEPVTFARSFAPVWCEESWTPTQAYEGIRKLDSAGVIKSVGRDPATRSFLWLPGGTR
jgi:hypothetical protein